ARLRPLRRVARLLVRAGDEARLDELEAAERADAAPECGLGADRGAGGARDRRAQAPRSAFATCLRSSTKSASSASRLSERRIAEGWIVAITTGARSDPTGTPGCLLPWNCRPR